MSRSPPLLAPPSRSDALRAGPLSTLTLPSALRARPSKSYDARGREPSSPARDHGGGHDYNLKRRRIEDERRGRGRESECRHTNSAQYFLAPAHGRPGSISSVVYYRVYSPAPSYRENTRTTRASTFTCLSMWHAHQLYSRHSQHLNRHDSHRRYAPQPPPVAYQGPPRVDARELVRGQKEHARRAVAGYDFHADERHGSASKSAAGMKRSRSGSNVPSYANTEADNDGIDAMLFETTTDSE